MTLERIHETAVVVVAIGALLRGVALILLAVRAYVGRERFASVRIDRGFVLIAPEPFLMLGLAISLLAKGAPPAPTDTTIMAALCGAVLVCAGWVIILWTVVSWPSIFVGHALLVDHRLVTTGTYALVRHPTYLGALLIWLGLGLAFTSWWVIGFAVAYVLPAYIVYMREEEAMLAEAFGEVYHRYRSRVPMLIPRLARRVDPVTTVAG
jgi:protein-S-isoprenylcysteine O-methyltransferase Ste14